MLLSIIILVDDAFGRCRQASQYLLMMLLVGVGACFGQCRKNLGPYRDLFLSVSVSVSMLVDDALGPCRDGFWSVLMSTLISVAEYLNAC